jgi:transcriptional regulator with AAA-type ATPase domain
LTQELYETPILIAAQKTKRLQYYITEAEKFFVNIRRQKGTPSKDAINAMLTLYKKVGNIHKAKKLVERIKTLTQQQQQQQQIQTTPKSKR